MFDQNWHAFVQSALAAAYQNGSRVLGESNVKKFVLPTNAAG